MKRFVVLAAHQNDGNPGGQAGCRRSCRAPAMQKQVTQQGGFVLYLPAGWKAEEGRDTNLDMPRVAALAPLRPHRLADGSASFQIPAA